MALKKISQLPLDNAVVGTDVVPIVSDGATKRVQLETLGTYFATIIGGGGASLPSGTEGYVLTYVSGSWVAAEAPGGVTSYNDLTDLPDLSGYLTSIPSHAASHQDGGSDMIYINYTQVDGLETYLNDWLPTATTSARGAVKVDGTTITITDGVISVAAPFSGSYNDLTNKPTLFSGAYADLSGKPTLFSGVYADLSGKPTLFDGSYTSLSNVPSTFTPTSHTHGNITNAGAIGSTSGQIVVTTTSGVLTTAASISSTQVSGLGTLATQSGTFSGTSSGTNTGDQTIALTGDVTGSGTGSFAATLANTAVTSGSYGSASSVATFTVDAKGRLTAAGSTSISIASGAVSGLGGAATLNVGTSAGTVAAGDHTHTQLHDRSHAITSTSDHTAGNWKTFYSNGSGQLVELAVGAANTVLTSAGTAAAPTFSALPTYTRQSDTVANVSYIGVALTGTATSTAAWKIKKTTISSAGAVSSSVTATNVKWDDRLTASYS